jgi:hypothetical protein
MAVERESTGVCSLLHVVLRRTCAAVNHCGVWREPVSHPMPRRSSRSNHEVLRKEKARDTAEAMRRTCSRSRCNLMINLSPYARPRLFILYQASGESDPGSEPGLTLLH